NYIACALDDPRRALEAARGFKPDLVLVDLIMPRADGLEVATQVEADWALHEVPMTYAPASRASWVAIEPTMPAAPCTRTLCPARRRPCSNSPCHAVRPGITRAAPSVKS